MIIYELYMIIIDVSAMEIDARQSFPPEVHIGQDCAGNNPQNTNEAQDQNNLYQQSVYFHRVFIFQVFIHPEGDNST